MAKRVQLVLNQDVRKLGRYGDIVEVAPGYARNYLVPQGMASRVTPGILRQVEKKREIERQRLAELKLVAEKQQEAIAKVGTFSISKQVGEKGAIFGTVTNGEVADVIKEVTGQEIDRREITVPDVDQLGTYEVEIRLHPEITIAVNIEVVAK